MASARRKGLSSMREIEIVQQAEKNRTNKMASHANVFKVSVTLSQAQGHAHMLTLCTSASNINAIGEVLKIHQIELINFETSPSL